MKKQMQLLMALGVFVVLITGFNGTAHAVCDHVTLEWIQEYVPLSPDTRLVQKKDQAGICEVVLAIDGGLVPVYAGKDWLLAGKMFQKGRFVTAETLDSLSDVAEQEREKARIKEEMAKEKRKLFFKAEFKKLADLTRFSFKPGQAKSFIYVITDPNCSHCKAMMPDLEFMAMEGGVELKMIIHPVLGPESLDMTRLAICENYDYAAYKGIQPPEAKVSCDAADQLIRKTTDLFKAAQTSFVPLVVAGDGSWVVEGNDICQVKTHLGIPLSEEDRKKGGACRPPEGD